LRQCLLCLLKLNKKFPALSDILKVKVGTKYVWENRVKRQTLLVHLLEEVYGIKLNFQAFSFYPNRLYFGMPLSFDRAYARKARPFWKKIEKIFEKNRWKVFSAFSYANPDVEPPQKFTSFEDVGFGYAQLLLSELVLMDVNRPSHGVGRQIELSSFQPLIGFSKGAVSRMVKGRPGSLILKYKKGDELLKILFDISKRKSFRAEPFYIKKCSKHSLPAVFKGKQCLNCFFKDFS